MRKTLTSLPTKRRSFRKPNAPFIGLDGKALPEGQVKIDTTAADVFVKWMTSEHAKALIAFYGETKYGGSLFTLMDGYLK